MFKSFFLSRRWMLWSLAGTAVILLATWYRVQLDVEINEWFGTFYDLLQKALGKPGAITPDDFWGEINKFLRIAMVYVLIAVVLDFFVRHWIFRWRTAMNNYYMAHWDKLRHIEGAAQRVQEDTMRFATIMEGLGIEFMRSLMVLAAFLPILATLSAKVTELPYFGAVPYSLVWVAIGFALAGTALLALVGIKLPGLQFHNQRVEAAYRKELVYGEDDPSRATPPRVGELFGAVRTNYFRLYFHYFYFDVAKWSYIQFGVMVPYIALAPTIVSGVITLGVMQQTVRAFTRVESAFQFLVLSWSTIVELLSVYKRLRAFEQQIDAPPPAGGAQPTPVQAS